MSATAGSAGVEKYFQDERVEAIRQVAKEILVCGAYKATKYLSDKLTVKATRKRFKGKFHKKVVDITLTIGPPNYEEREKIKQAKKAAKGQAGWAVPMAVKYPPKTEK